MVTNRSATPFPIREGDRKYLRDKFQHPVFDPATGLDNGDIARKLDELGDEMAASAAPRAVAKARAFELVARQVRIDVDPRDWFVGIGCWNRNERPLTGLITRWSDEQDALIPENARLCAELNERYESRIWKDFDHSVPDWDAVLALGFPGLRDRARRHREEHGRAGTLTPEVAAHFDSIDIVYGAILDLLERYENLARARRDALPGGDNQDGPDGDGAARLAALADSLGRLRRGPPTDFFDVLQFTFIYFLVSEHIDRMQVRSLGNLDRLWKPYFDRDRAAGRFDENRIREFLAYFMMQFASINNYWGHPFFLGGTRADGGSEVNELSFLILDVYDQLDVSSPKIQLKIAPNTPDAFLDKALDMIRRGRSGIAFVSETGLARAFGPHGFPAEEIRTCDISGCYELTVRGRGNCTGVGHLNLLRILEYALHDGVDPRTGRRVGPATGRAEDFTDFPSFLTAYFRQLDRLIEDNIRAVAGFERALEAVCPGPVYSATIENSLRTGLDAFSRGCVYNDSVLMGAGFASIVDSLAVLRSLVFEKKELGLAEFRDILDRDWEGHERLRQRILNSHEKFGNGVDRVDELAATVARHFGERINGRPNFRGGSWFASGHCALAYLLLGEKTGASPDGRRAGEEMSKNLSPVQGMDRRGVTALIRSLSRLDPAWLPGNFPLDVMLHPATVAGADGLAGMRGLLRTYAKIGVAVQFNIFDAETLLDAREHPEKYQSLQVRVCGWNVRWNDLARREQNAFIERARNLAE